MDEFPEIRLLRVPFGSLDAALMGASCMVYINTPKAIAKDVATDPDADLVATAEAH